MSIALIARASTLASLALLGWLPASHARQSQILEVHNSSLTTYLPAAKTAVNDVRPQHAQRGVNLDGSLRASSPQGMALNGNPFESAWVGQQWQGDLRIDLGSYAPTDPDLQFPAAIPWPIGRTYNALQLTEGASPFDSDGPQGRNWYQSSMPELVEYAGTTDLEDVILLVYGADRYIEFRRLPIEGSETVAGTEYKAVNGAAGVLQLAIGSPDTYIYTDQQGREYAFIGFNSTDAPGQLWMVTDATWNGTTGNIAYVGSKTSASAAIAAGGYDANTLGIKVAYDSNDYRYTYTYTPDANWGGDRLTRVLAERKSGGTWASPTGVETVGQVEYDYYKNSDSHGDSGDLKLVTVTIPLSDAGINQIQKKYYRYWEGSADGVSNYSSGNPGYVHQIKYVFDAEGTRRQDWQDSALDGDFLSETDANLEAYAAAYFEYDASRRLSEVWIHGNCGCGSGSSSGVHNYTYEANSGFTPSAGYTLGWQKRTVVQRPDGGYLTQYFDETSQSLSTVVTDAPPTQTSPSAPLAWCTVIERDATGCVVRKGLPSNATAYTHSTGTITSSATVGLSWAFERTSSGEFLGFATSERWREGWDSSAGNYWLQRAWAYDDLSKVIGVATVVRPLQTESAEYSVAVTSGTTGRRLTQRSYTAYSGSLAIEVEATTLPAVDTTRNGSGSSNTRKVHFTKDGYTDFVCNEDGTIDYTPVQNGLTDVSVQDALTGSGGDIVSPPSGFASTGSPLRHKFTHTYDNVGRLLQSGMAYGTGAPYRTTRNYTTRLADHRVIQLSYPRYESTTPTFYGPVEFTVVNQAGQVEAEGLIALDTSITTSQSLHIDETQSDPLAAIDIGTVVRYRTIQLDGTGTEQMSVRDYFDIPGTGSGTVGTNYDASETAYDGMGRVIRSKDATGTILRYEHDIHGRTIEEWIGTNDNGELHGESSGTNNMVQTESLSYDSGGVGDGHLTEYAVRVTATTTDERIKAFLYDVKGNRVVEINAVVPHIVRLYNNLGEELAVGAYSASTGLDPTDNPTSLATNRVALRQSAYDELGRTWKVQRHKIDPSDGSDDDSLTAETWFDARGRPIKHVGEEYSKTAYDRLGRVLTASVLADDDDSVYADVSSVSGDIVLEETTNGYSTSDGTLIVTSHVARHPWDKSTGQTVGPLDADGASLQVQSGTLEGRAQITAFWYDNLQRETDRVEFGTNSGATFDRTLSSWTSPPTSSSTAPRTTIHYGSDGEVERVTDPRGKVTKYERDDLGRTIAVIQNYDTGVAGGAPSGTDDNVTVRYQFTHGLTTKYIADLPGGADQETIYTYGTTKGTSLGDSAIATGNLLQKVTYPDSTGSTDAVTYAYNAAGELVWRKDQAGNVIELVRDARGRVTHRRVSTLASGFDGEVRRIESEYDALSRLTRVAQWNNEVVGSGSIIDETEIGYDGWGNLTAVTQDNDSSVGGSGYYTVSHQYLKATGGRKTLRRELTYLPSGGEIGYTYSSGGGLFDDATSRVSTLSYTPDGGSPVAIAEYEYLGESALVGTTYPEIDSYSRLHDTSALTYPNMDVLNRTIASKWTKDLSTDVDFYSVSLEYDASSNIVSAADEVHGGFDVKYGLDDVDRVVDADEGTLSGGAITARTRRQEWTLSHTGNWDNDKVDLNGDGDWADTNEVNDTRSHNSVNELATRDTDNNGTANFTLGYDAVGNLTDDGKEYMYEWDPFGRLRIVKTQGGALVSKYRYNGLGHRIGVHYDANSSGTVDGSDPWYFDVFNERWQQVARVRGTDVAPKEEFVHHAAGRSGEGYSSYIDSVACRLKDTAAWTSASDGVLDERLYFCQNWRADVSAVVYASGVMGQWVKYSAYGVPFGVPAADTNSDGDCDAADIAQINTWRTTVPTPVYDVRGDYDLDGDVDAADESAADTGAKGVTLGVGKLARTRIAFRREFSGQESMPANQSSSRFRVYSATIGRWTRRDVLGFVDGSNLYEGYVSSPVAHSDPTGLAIIAEPRRPLLPHPGTGTGVGQPDPDPCDDECASHSDCGMPRINNIRYKAGFLSREDFEGAMAFAENLSNIGSALVWKRPGFPRGDDPRLLGGGMYPSNLPEVVAAAGRKLYNRTLKVNKTAEVEICGVPCNQNPCTGGRKKDKRTCGLKEECAWKTILPPEGYGGNHSLFEYDPARGNWGEWVRKALSDSKFALWKDFSQANRRRMEDSEDSWWKFW